MRLNPQIIQQQITGLLLQYPEMADDDALRINMIEAETEALEFLDTVVRQIEESKILEEGTALRIQELSERKSRFERRQEALRSLCFKIMQTGDIKKAELSTATLSIRNNPPKVMIHDEAALPPDCVKTTVSPDKTAIKNKLQAGEAVPGAFLSNSEPSLSLRVK